MKGLTVVGKENGNEEIVDYLGLIQSACVDIEQENLKLPVGFC